MFRSVCYRDRRLPNGNISCSVMVTYPDGRQVHEEIEMPPEVAQDEQEHRKFIHRYMREMWQARPRHRVPEAVKRDRRKEWEALDIPAEEFPD